MAINGADAVEMVKNAEIKKAPFDLIIMDLQMPILNGYEACQQIVTFYQMLDRDALDIDNSPEVGNSGLYSGLDNQYEEKRWLADLKLVFHEYLFELNQTSSMQSDNE